MSISRKSSQTDAELPLSPEQIETGSRVADRLISEIREVIRSLPLEIRGLGELSEHLKVDRNLVQRLLGASKLKDPVGVESLMQVPGPRGLLQFLAALRGAGVGDHEFDGLAAATKLFAEYLQEVGSQASLGRRLALRRVEGTEGEAGEMGDMAKKAEEGTGQVDDPAARMFRDSRSLVGCSMDAMVTIAVIRKLGDEPLEVEDIFCEAHLGYTGTPQSVPLSFHTYTLPTDGMKRWGMSDMEGNEPFGLSDNSVMREFSSDPLPTIVAVPTQAGNGVLHIVDSADWRQGSRHDLVTLNRIRATMDSKQGDRWQAFPERELSTQASYPTRNLLMDVYVEKSLFREFTTPEAGCHIWDTDLERKYRQRWLSMLPVKVPVEFLPPRVEQATTEIYPRHTELTQRVFELAGAERSRFVGFRIRVSHPIWRAWYRIRFDFLGE